MDIKDIIKWFIPCFLYNVNSSFNLYRNFRLCSILPPCCFCIFFFLFRECTATESSESDDELLRNITRGLDYFWRHEITETSRTFGRPMKKLTMVLIPLVFQLGAASTWAIISAILSFKAVAIGLLLLMTNIAAGAAKLSALFASKFSHHEKQPVHWQPPQKEVHLHIHNGGSPGHHTGHEEYYGDHWNRGGQESAVQYLGSSPAVSNDVISGPQTINTPYGSYVRVGPPQTNAYL